MLTVEFNGLRLPIIDIRRPEFQERDDHAALEALRISFETEEKRRRRMPRFVMKLIFALASRNAPLLKALATPGRSYLDSLSTYVMKLLPEQLPPPFDNKIDRKIVASPFAASVRIRMQQIAHLVANALEQELGAKLDVEFHLINIAGGPAMDSINALLLLDAKGALVGRTVAIHVLDREAEGAEFGKRVLEALILSGAFKAAQVSLRYHPYDWATPSTLTTIIRPLVGEASFVGAMSEGGLFEYAEDDIVLANLIALRANGARFVAGSVTRSDRMTRRALQQMRFRLHPRGADGLELLAASAGYKIAEICHALTSDQVWLIPGLNARTSVHRTGGDSAPVI